MPDRTCTIAGCSNTHRVRGLCSTHYNQQHPDRHRRHLVACTACETLVLRCNRSDRRPTCSPECRAALQHGTYHPEARWPEEAARRARQAGATDVELIIRRDVLERDDWRCHLCGERTNPDASIYDPSSPTVDHVIPLSRGGQHTLVNVRCAHLGCNSLKHDALLTPGG